jgi:hypothetical protein
MTDLADLSLTVFGLLAVVVLASVGRRDNG